MKGARVVGHFLLLILAVVAAEWAVTCMIDMKAAADNYDEHHEVTVPVCRFIARMVLALGLGLAGVRCRSALPLREVMAPLAALALPALMAAGAALIFVNEIFFSLYDPKGFPVHPTEPVMLPEAGWHSMSSALLASLLLFFSFGWMWRALRPPTSARKIAQENRMENTGFRP